MKKSILLFVLALGLSLSAHAQVYGPSAVGNRFGTYTGGSQGDYAHGARGFVELSPLGFTLDQILLPNLFGGYGYQFNPHFYVGGALGLGSYEYYSYYSGSRSPKQSLGFSLCADLRYYFYDAISTPFLALCLGMSNLIDDAFSPYIGGTFGYRFGLNNGRAMNVSMGLISLLNQWGGPQLQLVVGYEF